MARHPLLIVCLALAVIVIAGVLFEGTVESESQSQQISLPVWSRADKFVTTEPISNSIATRVPRLPDSTTKILELSEPQAGSLVGTLKTVQKTDPPIDLAAFGVRSMPEPSANFDGLINLDNVPVYNLLIIPADMNGDVGPNHYVQAANALLRVFDKNGVPLTPPFRISTLFQSLGTVCSTRNDGLPIVLYDPLADRWVISQVCSAFPPFRQMVAVSASGDPTGSYHVYEFVMPNVKINDFPKFGVWTDAYYMSTDEFLGSTYTGSGMFAFDREKMLNGDPTASYIYFNMSETSSIRRRGMLPSDLDGLRTPAEGSPNIFASYTATEYGEANDAISLFDFKPDFANPAASTFTERPESPISVPPFDPTSPDGRADIAQPAPGERLDSQSDRLSYRLAYRNHGTHESLVVGQTVRTTSPESTYRAGVRVYELRRTDDVFDVHFASTLGDTDSSRWIGSAAQDHRSNLAVGYNFVSDTKRVSIRYSGRLSTDPQNEFRAEGTLIEGTGVQKAFGWRWGDYSGMSVDPIDDCTFWMTNGYYTLESEEISDFTWLTRIGRFKFAECEPATIGQISGSVADATNGTAIGTATIAAAAYSRRADQTGNYGPLNVLPGTYQLLVSAPGYSSQTRTLSISGGPAIENFLLEPVPVAVESGTAIVGESCSVNNAPEPGELITLNVSLSNEGRRDATNVVTDILPNAALTDIGPPQTYGPIPIGGSPVTRPFTFRISLDVDCGSVVNLVLRVRDGLEELEQITIPLRTGSPVTAFSANFDEVAAPALPAGWTTSTTTNHQLWRTSSTRRQSEPNALFSPAPIQAGVNEVVSPVFQITSPDAQVSFRHWYELETTFLRNRLYDGSVLELKIGDGEWSDILTAGGSFIRGGYDGTIDSCCSNPLAGRQGWSGRSGVNQVSEFIDTKANLPATAAGNSVRLRWRVGTDIGAFREGQYIDDLIITDGYACSCKASQPRTAPFDFDGDGKTDLSLYNLNDQPDLPDTRILNSSNAQVSSFSFGSANDVPVYADYDGDGKTDLAVFRPSDGVWFILRSSSGSIDYVNFGISTDVPVPADFDGDGRADIGVFRASEGVWYLLQSTAGFRAIQFGSPGDLPVPADFDGDGSADIAVFRPSNGVWYSFGSGSGISIVQFGSVGDRPVPGDFDGDGRADRVVYRPSQGIWYLLRSKDGLALEFFGLAEDQPLQADFDGDGRLDIALYRPSDQVWYHLRSSDGGFRADQFGNSFERPIPGIFVRSVLP